MSKEQGHEWKEKSTFRSTQWEPFLGAKDNPRNQFQNRYNGLLAPLMELNRSGVEKILQVGAVEGKVTLVSLSPSWPDFQEKGALPVLITFSHQGWEIGICDQQIIDELLEEIGKKKIPSEKLPEESVRRFNWFLRWGLLDVLAKENPPHPSLRNLWAATGTGLAVGLATREFVPAMGIAFIAWLWMGGSELEFNRVVRGWAFFRWKGKNLVRETRGESLI